MSLGGIESLKSNVLNRAKPIFRSAPRENCDQYLPDPQLYALAGVPALVRGHGLGDPQHLSYPSSHYEIRVYGRTPGDQLAVFDFRDLTPKTGGEQRHLVFQLSQSEMEAPTPALASGSARPMMPKDHSLRVRSMEFTVGSQDASERYFEQLTEIGTVEGFLMVGLTGPDQAPEVDGRLSARGYKNFSLLEPPRRGTWLEDFSEPLLGGGRLLPPQLPRDSDWFRRVITQGREERLAPHGLSADFPCQGMTNQVEGGQLAKAQGLLQGQLPKLAESYFEGGNLLPGTRADGTPYVLVGRDSLVIASALIEESSGQKPAPRKVLAALAQDLGVDPSQLFPVEQPGAFHVDMRMMPIGPGELILQDSRLAAQQHITWLEEEARTKKPEALPALEYKKQQLLAWADRMAPLEDLAARDLEKAGLTVHRVAGAFMDVNSSGQRDEVNFFNSRHGTSSEGVRYSILMGASAQVEAHFAKALLEDLKAPIDRLYFLDPSQTGSTLTLQGGLKCRSKSLGDVVGPATVAPLALEPYPSQQCSLFPAHE